MRATITIIARRLKAHHDQYKLPQPISGSWYQLPAILHTRIGNEIFVQVKIPITLRSAKYTIYDIQVYPLPVDNDSYHATKIVNIPRYLAINKHDRTSYYKLGNFCVRVCVSVCVSVRLYVFTVLNARVCVHSLIFERIISKCAGNILLLTISDKC
jgi:hypothetical protein